MGWGPQCKEAVAGGSHLGSQSLAAKTTERAMPPRATAFSPKSLFHGMDQAPLAGYLVVSCVGLPSISGYRVVSVLCWLVCFLTSFESLVWMVLLEDSSFRAALRKRMALLYSPCWACRRVP